ncbi:hypothetical protein F8388_020638 [Cannabis sativa]|uniref:Uncharacterized protein n=1 Tax=Cannabis sativa TaxID=3483 RepID=A0A7J6F2I3_CANSA|nr:hypothetical protein F8388_020638 [Cannabis sativa]
MENICHKLNYNVNEFVEAMPFVLTLTGSWIMFGLSQYVVTRCLIVPYWNLAKEKRNLALTRSTIVTETYKTIQVSESEIDSSTKTLPNDTIERS